MLGKNMLGKKIAGKKMLGKKIAGKKIVGRTNRNSCLLRKRLSFWTCNRSQPTSARTLCPSR